MDHSTTLSTVFVMDSNSTVPLTYPTNVLVVAGVSCLLSILGSGVIFGTFLWIPAIRSFTRKLIVCLTVADLLSASGYAISVIRYARTNNEDNVENSLCHVQAIITSFSSLASFFLTIAIAVHVCSIVVCRDQGRDCLGPNPGTRTLVWYNLLSWLPPAVIVYLANDEQILGESTGVNAGATGPWCWINTDNADRKVILWQVLAGKGWEILCYIVTVALYILVKCHMYVLRHRREIVLGNFVLMTEENRNFLYVWFVLYFFRLWGTTRFFIGVFDKSLTEKNTKVMDVLLYMQAFGDPAQAFGNCVLYCFLDSSVRGRLSEFCCHTSGLYRNRVSSSRRSASSLVNYGSTSSEMEPHYFL